jgi:hypothetical protein
MRRISSWGIAAVMALALACACQQAIARTQAPSASAAAKKPGKKKPKTVTCKPGQARIRVGKRQFCVSNQLPSAHTTPQAAAVRMALGLSLSRARDRRGRRPPALPKLLGRFGAGTLQKVEQAAAKGLATGEALQRLDAITGHASAASRIAFAAANCSTPEFEQKAREELEKATPQQKQAAQEELDKIHQDQSFKNGDVEANVNLETGAIKLGVDIKGKGVKVELTMRSCGEGKLQVDSCPTVAGVVEGHDTTEIEFAMKVREGAKLLMSQGLKMKGETTIKAQTGDDGKLDSYDIKHVYNFSGTLGGGKQNFGPVTVDYTYIGEAHIDMRSGNQKPPPAVVDVHVSMAGVEPAEAIAAEIELAHKAQAEADKEFSAEVEKTTARLRKAEEHWLKPNECASMHFEPESEKIKLKKGQTGTVNSRIEAKSGGAPAAASWTLSGQQNATFTPGGSEGNPLSTSYTVTKAFGAVVSATFKATSKAGVAEAPWKQQTEALTEVDGTFTGRFDDHAEVIEWTGSAIFVAIETLPSGVILKLSASSVTATASGETPFECEQKGEQQVPLFVGSTFNVESLGEAIVYQTDTGWGFPGRMKATLMNCAEPSLDGTPYEPDLGNWAMLSGDAIHGGPSALIKTSPDGVTFDGSATATGSEASEKYSWSWSFKGS